MLKSYTQTEFNFDAPALEYTASSRLEFLRQLVFLVESQTALRSVFLHRSEICRVHRYRVAELTNASGFFALLLK